MGDRQVGSEGHHNVLRRSIRTGMANARLRREPQHAVRWPFHYRLSLRYDLTYCSGTF